MKVNGDAFIICTFNFTYVNVIESNNNLLELSKAIPEALLAHTERLSICSVKHWVASKSDPSDSIPQGLETLFTIEPYEIDEEHVHGED